MDHRRYVAIIEEEREKLVKQADRLRRAIRVLDKAIKELEKETTYGVDDPKRKRKGKLLE